jgi:hypothetical protein
MEFVVRGIGLVNSLDDLRRIAVRTRDGVPIYLEDIAEISIGGDFRRGALDVDGREVVGGVVIMRTGENAMQVIQRVKERLADIAPSLPKGITIVPFYDRSGLIDRTIETLRGFVQEVQERIAREIKLPAGVTLKWSGQYESQLSAQRTLMLIVPVVLLIIFMLLSVVFRSVMEAAHVILAVPFALTGGAILQYLLGYNFSVAVWIGYIALFGTAIQRRCDGCLSRGGAEKADGRGREIFFASRPEDRCARRSHVALEAKGNDGRHRRGQPSADYVEHSDGSRDHETTGYARYRRNAQQPLACAHRYPVIFYWLRRKALKV